MAFTESGGDACDRRPRALRLHAADVARTVLRTAKQLHGASGVAEEYDISVLCRRVKTLLRSPASSERILEVLVGAIREDGFASPFPHGRRNPPNCE